jgi:endonuclease/exonuclease/phosphatase family metal-dependent hydrolase
MMHKLLILLVTVSLALLPQAQSAKRDAHRNEKHLLETGQSVTLRSTDEHTKALKIVSYNIRYRSGKELTKLIELLKTDPEIGEATIIGLQEVDRNRKRSGNTNTAKQLAQELGMHYAWAAPPTPNPNQEEETGVALLSAYPLSEVHRLVLPHEGPNHRRRVGIGATIVIGKTKMRVYSVHAETRISTDKKMDQLKAAIQDLAQYPRDLPAIVLGDFNTWEPGAEDKTRKLFIGEGFHTPFKDDSTFRRNVLMVPIKFRLDWIWLRNLEATNSGIDKEISLSDHFPLWVGLKLKAS